MTLGPFDVPAERVQVLGIGFTPFVNQLLETEASAHHLRGYLVAINSNETTPDGGVDAAIRGSPGTDFIPRGDSAWQFKRSGYGPTACANEFADATWAHEFLRDGGSYIIAIATALPDKLIQTRRRAIAAKAIDLGLLAADDPSRIRVYDANMLARWASRFPALAASRLAGGPGTAAVDFNTWSAGRTHVNRWVPDEARSASIQAIRSQVTSNGIVDVRVQGEAGIGKTRLVLEALRDGSISPLVAYVADVTAVSGELLMHLITEGRTAILVVDDCPAERHVKLAERLPADPAIKLITIGQEGAAATRTPVIGLGAVGASTTEEFLKTTYQQLSSEARRFVTDHSRGNMRWTIVLADRITNVDDAQAADLIARNDIEQFVARFLPEGRDFFCSAVLALFERVGWDGELRYQLDLLAQFAGASVEEMESAASRLEQQGLLIRQGRYRSVAPHPLAVYLAAEGWRAHNLRLVTELLPQLDEGMAQTFFRRVADLGRFEPARSVLPRLLARNGPFGSLQQLESNGLGRSLTQLAIVLPDEVALHLGELIEDSTLESLRAQRSSRRDLVWTLEKLVWHSRTFETAADALRRLALAENETYSNNATGAWIDLFGTMLPGTAASPHVRTDYITRVAASDDRDVRLLSVKAAARALVPHETIGVSGELQGGVLVEPRGRPATWNEVAEYRRVMISLLSNLANDSDAEVSTSSADALIGAIHPLINDPLSGQDLANAAVQLEGDAQRRLRAQVEHLISLHNRAAPDDQIRGHLTSLLERLPPQAAEEDLQVLAQLKRWDFNDGELAERIAESLRAISDMAERRRSVLDILMQNVPAAWELGQGIASVDGFDSETLQGLVDAFDVAPSALAGYLSALQASEYPSIFEDFLASELAGELGHKDHVNIAIGAPATDWIRNYVLSQLRELSVAEGAYSLFSWQRNLNPEEMLSLFRDWVARLESQIDYSALVQWLAVAFPQKGTVPASLRGDAWMLLSLRRQYPELGQQRWAWGQLAFSFVSERCVELSNLLFDLMDADQLLVMDKDQEALLLAQCAQTCGAEIWPLVGERIRGGSWRLQMELRGWFLAHIRPDVVSSWIGSDKVKARIVASIAPIGDEKPTEYARFLLDKFGTDQEVASSLYGTLVSGMWFGNESDRIAGQIERLRGWRSSRQEPLGVRRWAGETIEYLERSRQAALQREAEERF